MNSYLSVYAAPFDRVSDFDLYTKGKFTILLILFKQTTKEKVRTEKCSIGSSMECKRLSELGMSLASCEIIGTKGMKCRT